MFDYFTQFYLNQRQGATWIVGEVLFIFATVLTFSLWSLERKNILRFLLKLIGGFLIMILLDCIYFSIFQDPRFLKMVCCLLFIGIMAAVDFQRKPLTRVILATVFYSCYFQTLAISQRLFLPAAWEDYYTEISFTIHITLLLSEVMILHYFSIDDLTFVPGYCVAILEMICVLSSVTEAVYTGIRVGERYDFDKVMGVVSWTFLLILLLMYGMFKVLAQRVNKVVALQAQMKTMETDAAMVAQSDQNIEDTRKMRHDLKNHIAYMKSLLEQQDYQALNDYLAILAETATEPISHLDCGNQVINSIMNFEISKAVSHGITVEPSIILPPELPFQAPDLTSLFCNILDNAIEACLFYKSAQPVIKISMAIQGDYFISRVTNPIPAEVNKQQVLRLDSTKQEKGSHGYGTRIIRSIAQKYRGKVVFDISDGLFMADVMMDMKSEVKHD